MEQLEEFAGNLLLDEHLDPGLLAGPEVTDKGTITAGLGLRETVGLVAGQRDDIGGRVVVADVGTKATLVGGLARAVGAEVNAVGVLATGLRARLPLVKNLKGLLVVLENDETGVEIDSLELVLVVGVLGVVSESEGVGGRVQAPEVHEPLEGNIHMVHNSIRIHEDAGVVVLKDLADNGRLGP